ncbi:uncharacterized protein LOC111114438 isoform X2 [Crassostrea virginica]
MKRSYRYTAIINLYLVWPMMFNSVKSRQEDEMKITMCLLLLSHLGIQVWGSTISTAKVTLYTHLFTWNGAQEFCLSVNQTLLTVDTQERLNALGYFMNKEPWVAIKDRQFWTGLHATVPNAGRVFQWAGSCQQPPRTVVWGSNPTTALDHSYCGYIQMNKSNEMELDTSDCVLSKRMFMCQNIYNHCLYDVIPRAFGNIMASKHIANTSVADCQDKCENYVTEDGHRCLGFNFNDVIQTCGLMTGENLFRLDKHHRPSPVHRLFIRRCEIQAKLDATILNIFEDSACFLRPVSQCVVKQRFCRSGVSPDDSSITDGEKCDCKRHNAHAGNLTERIEKIIETIRVPPKNTSIAIRQKISVSDSRVSSRGIGYVAMAIMSTIFGGIVLMDLSTFRWQLAGYMDARRFSKGLRTNKHRVN